MSVSTAHAAPLVAGHPVIIVLGNDPSERNWGYARAGIQVIGGAPRIIDLRVGITRTEKSQNKQVRASSDHLQAARLLREGYFRWCEGVALSISEVNVSSQNASALLSYGICIGILAGSPVPVVEVDQREVKKAATGKAGASKAEIMAWARHNWPRAGWTGAKCNDEHMADAAAAVAAGIQTQQFLTAAATMAAVRTAAE